MTTSAQSVSVEDIKSKYKPGDILPTHEDAVKATEDRVLSQTIPWEGYLKASLIRPVELEMLKKYDKKPMETKISLFQKDGEAYAELFMDLIVKLNKEETLQYLLSLIDEITRAYPECIRTFCQLSNKNPSYPSDPFIRILGKTNIDWYTWSKTSIILATWMSSLKSFGISDDTVKLFCRYLREQLRQTEENDVCNAISALQKLLAKDSYREFFAIEDGIGLLVFLLKSKSKNSQILYEVVYVLWLLSFNKHVAEKMNDTKVIPSLIELLRTVSKDKVIRLSLATLRNLLDISTNNEEMITYGIVKPLESLLQKNWSHDEDVLDDLQTIKEALQKNIAQLTSFDVYKGEVMSGNLSWSAVHRSEKFWRENAQLLEEDNCKLLLVLRGLLTTSTNPVVLSVACFDIGEFARFHPRGKQLIQQLSIKIPLMALMENKDPDVKKNAILAVQKLMVTNWEYLSI